MVHLSSIAVHEGAGCRRMGLRRALITRRANLGDCNDAASVLRKLASPRALRRPAVVVPLSRPARGEPGAADLALQVSRQALAGCAGTAADSVGALIYCHSTPDEHTAESSAGRLQFQLGLRRANPFSVSQAHNTALLAALDLAAGLIEGPEAAEAVLLVAADKQLFGTPPNDAQRMVLADVAAAAVLTEGSRPGWRVEQVLLRQFDTPCTAQQAWPDSEMQAFAECAAGLLHDSLAQLGLRGADLSAVLCPTAQPGFVAAVHRRAGLPAAEPAAAGGLRGDHLASAELLLHLARLEPHAPPGRPVLAWAHGNNGELGCCVLTRSAA